MWRMPTENWYGSVPSVETGIRTRRTCGYIGTQFWNQGRTQEIKDRVLHL